MKNKKTLLIVAVISVVALASYFICSKYNNSTAAETKKLRIGFVVPTMDNPFFVDMINGAKAKAQSMQNVEIIQKAPLKVEDALEQSQYVENLITLNVDAICIVPTNSESIIPVIKKANETKIPIINIDNKIDMELAKKEGAMLATYVGSDNFDGGKLAGKYMIEKLGGKGNVAVLEGVSGNDAANKRKAGFLEALKSSPDIKVVASQVANWNREQAFNSFQNILKANPELNGVFACNDEMALGVSAALEQSKIPKHNMVIVGFDAIKEALDAVQMGKIDATIAQQPALMGEKGVGLALDVIAKKALQTSYATELKVIKK